MEAARKVWISCDASTGVACRARNAICGRGGAGAGYEEKLVVIEEERAKFFVSTGTAPKTIFEDILIVPLAQLNAALEARGEPWLVRVVQGDEYEFFFPGH